MRNNNDGTKTYTFSQARILKGLNLPADTDIIEIVPNVPRSRGGAVLIDRGIKFVVQDYHQSKRPWWRRLFGGK